MSGLVWPGTGFSVASKEVFSIIVSMMHHIRFFARRFLAPLLLYGAVIAFIAIHILTVWMQITFVAYALFLFWVIWSGSFTRDASEKHPDTERFFFALLVGSFLFFIATRLFLFVRYGGAPLGYDTGFYLSSIDSVLDGLWGHRSVRALLWAPLLWLGIPRLLILHGLYVLFQFLMVGGIYALTRSLQGSSRLAYAAIAVFLFAVSLPQFFAFWWMFYQTHLAIIFLLLTLALIHRRSWLALVTGGFGAAVHPATFLPFGIALGIFVVVQLLASLFRWKRPANEILFLFSLLLFAGILINEFGHEFILVYLRGSVNKYGWFITNFPDYLQQQFSGLYIDLKFFYLVTLYTVPFGILGLLLFLFRRMGSPHEKSIARFGFLFILACILFLLSYFPFIYQNRYLIYLDLILILFATSPMIIFIRCLFRERWGKGIVAVLLFGFIASASYMVWKQQPQIYPDELQEIKALATIGEPNAYAMVTESVYTPWMYAFSPRTIIDPGYLPANQWDYPMWEEFWNGKSDARRHELLHLYNQPIYLFVGKRVASTFRYKRFIESDAHFMRMSPHVWRYDPRSMSIEEIKERYAQEH